MIIKQLQREKPRIRKKMQALKVYHADSQLRSKSCTSTWIVLEPTLLLPSLLRLLATLLPTLLLLLLVVVVLFLFLLTSLRLQATKEAVHWIAAIRPGAVPPVLHWSVRRACSDRWSKKRYSWWTNKDLISFLERRHEERMWPMNFSQTCIHVHT